MRQIRTHTETPSRLHLVARLCPLAKALLNSDYNVLMDVHQVVKELRDERDRIIAAIDSLQRLAAGKGSRRRGRPPKWMQEAKEHKRRGRPRKSR